MAFRDLVWKEWLSCHKPVFEGSVAVSIAAYPPDKRKRDLDNLLKSTLDALERAGFFGDDHQVDDLRIRRHEVDEEAGGRLLVMIEETE